MSYLDLPRVHFGGTFQASPSTLNNTPNNYDPAFQSAEKTELYWAPDGNGIFNLVDCSVTALTGSDATTADTDSLYRQPVTAIYTKAPPKIVDLDPAQQNVSEIWGLNIQIGYPGGAHVSGVFKATPFSGIWQNAQGPKAPHDSSSGAAYFQSVLSELTWDCRDSLILQSLQQRSPDRLSMKFILSAHNNHSPEYLFNTKTLQSLREQLGDIGNIVNKLEVLKDYRQMNPHKAEPGSPQPTPGTQLGLLPTKNYVQIMCRQLIGEQLTRTHLDTILNATRQENKPGSTYEFDHGNIVGTIGSYSKEKPDFYTPARSLIPTKPEKEFCQCFYATAKNDPANDRITLDLGDSLPVDWPGQSPWWEKLGDLSVGYCKAGSFVKLADIPYINDSAQGKSDRSASDFIYKRAGILDIDITEHRDALSLPLTIVGTPNYKQHTFLQEDMNGFSIRADRFVFRMNPGVKTSESNYPEGDTQPLGIHVRQFGEIVTTHNNAPLHVSLQILSQAEAEKYTRGTVGTSGSAGIKNLSIPEGNDASVQVDSHTAVVEKNGVAHFTLTASDPGNPRQHVDGQIYFIRYFLQAGNTEIELTQDPNNLITVMNYDVPRIDGAVSWDNGIGEILRQFAFLYPVMDRIGLSDHQRVKTNAQEIKMVLSFPITHPLHMPVTRDLSVAKRKLIIDWLNAGAP